MEAFSDGVFAIAITLLVLEIAVPAGSEADLLGAVLDQWPSYLAYLVSFSTHWRDMAGAHGHYRILGTRHVGFHPP